MIFKRFAVAILLLSSVCAFSKTYYVSPTGSDANVGDIKQPFESITRAQQAAMPGDLVYLRGGTYLIREDQVSGRKGAYACVNIIEKSGEPNKPIKYWNYPGEKPVFDYSNVKAPNSRIAAFYITASWIHFKGFEVVGVQVTQTGHTQSESFENHGSNNVYEMLAMHDSQAIGFYLLAGSNNLILNCDAYRNYDFTSEGGKGGNSDGFGAHGKVGDKNNIFKGCRAWFNSDDGYDCINSFEPVVFENCWAFYNGYSTDFKPLADGNGFKAGGYAYRPANQVPLPIPRNVIRFCISVRNKANGFYSNHHREGSDWINNSAYMNAVNFNMLNRAVDNSADVPGFNHKMRNNLGFMARSKETDQINEKLSDIANNYFSLPLKVSEGDFESVDEKLLIAPRKADGSLPVTDFMRLKKGSSLNTAGIDAGFLFPGKKAPLGYYVPATN